ncbi:subtilisin-like serine protease [Apophysomyces sp. BC1021]|nr:subtilisin-like serine protease [Apophysomyces sp. BC1021]
MKSSVWVFIATTIAIEALKTPTHIIKFKESVNGTAAAQSVILNQHRTYVLENHQKVSSKSRKDLSEDEMMIWADSLGKQLSLESITVDKDFLAVAGVFGDANFVKYLHTKHDIEYVEPNQVYQTTVVLPRDEQPKQSLVKSVAANWGLARITHRQRRSYDEYFFDEKAGTDVHVYVLDSGINTHHRDFENRASLLTNFIYDEEEHDLNGHGTHVAGTIAGKTYGIAKNATVHSVKVLDQEGMGNTLTIIKGIKEVMKVAEPGKSLINLSISGSKSRVLNEIIDKAVMEYKIPVFVSAGNNGGMDACFLSPSSNTNVFTVGASDMEDHITSYSNIGNCVQIYAPGHRITSTWIGQDDATKIVDGTSMSNPHVTGIAAALMTNHHFETPGELYEALIRMATKDVLLFSNTKHTTTTNNLLAYHDLGQNV